MSILGFVVKIMVCLLTMRSTSCFVIKRFLDCTEESLLCNRTPAHFGKSFTGNHRLHSSSSSFDDLLEDVDRLLSEEVEENGKNKPKDNSNSLDGWKQIDWRDVSLRAITPSPVEEYQIQGRHIYVKRDDLLRLPGSVISGNKARKMMALNDLQNFPSYLVSYGGPQSNSMLALAAICSYKSRERDDDHTDNEEDSTTNNTPIKNKFIYYTKKIPRFLRNQPSGNYFRALSLGMEVRELSHQVYKDFFGGDSGGLSDPPIGLDPPAGGGDSLWVPQGGACPMASAGVEILAGEIVEFWKDNGDGKPLSVVVPGGTCSTGVLLHHKIKKLTKDSSDDIEVVVVPCVGDEAYARRQMMNLSSQVGAAANDIPPILLPGPENNNVNSKEIKPKYYAFGSPDKAILNTFEMLRDEYGLPVDLIYGAPAWTIILRHWSDNINSQGAGATVSAEFDPYNPCAAGREIMYVHSGGLEGINSQLLRYRHQGLIDFDKIQLPGKNKR